jgi:hypothetical protein
MKPQVVLYGLDFRQVNTIDVQKVANIGQAYELVVAPKLKGTELVNWIVDNTENLKEIIISIDALGYGDLIESRNFYPVEYIDEILYSTFEAIRAHSVTKNVKITAFNSILRTTPNLTSATKVAQDSYFREWDSLTDLLDNFSIDNKDATFSRIKELEKEINPELLANFKKTRERNLLINKRMLSWTDLKYIDRLIFFADQGQKFGWNRQNMEILQKKVSQLPSTLGGRVFFVGGEYGASVLLAGGRNQRYSGVNVKMYIDYGSEDEKTQVDAYETLALHANIVGNAEAGEIEIVDNPTNADFVLYHHNNASNTDALLSRIKANVDKAVVIVPSDSKEFISRLRKEVNINRLVAFSALGTTGSMIGTALGQAVSRIVALKTPKSFDKDNASVQAHVELLLQRFYENIYQTTKRYVYNLANAKGYDILNLRDSIDEVNALVDKAVRPRAISFYAERFHGRNVKNATTIDYKTTQHDLTRVTLPFYRTTEAEISPRVVMDSRVPLYGEFNDVPSGHWAYPHVMKLLKLDVVSGGGDGNFYPDAPMIRSHLAKLIYNLFKFNLDYVPNPGFSDVPSSHPFYKEIATLKHLGILNGNSATTFNPDGNVDRASIAIIISKLFGLDLTAEGRTVSEFFVDAGVVSWAKDSINLLGEYRIVSIPSDKKFNPSVIASRAVVATFLSKALERVDILNAEGTL